MEPVIILANFEVRSLPAPEIIATGVLGGVRTQSWGRGGRRGSGMVPLERALVSANNNNTFVERHIMEMLISVMVLC